MITKDQTLNTTVAVAFCAFLNVPSGDVVEIRCGRDLPGNMKVSFQAARSIG